MVAVVIGLGANIPSEHGTALQTLESSLGHIEDQLGQIIRRSPWYSSTPIGVLGQPDYVNGAVLIETKLEPTAILAQLHNIEHDLGRRRQGRWAARCIDLDLLVVEDLVLPSEAQWYEVADNVDPAAFLVEPIVPHPRLHKRLFALKPLQDVWPDWHHPLLAQDATTMISALEDEQVIHQL